MAKAGRRTRSGEDQGNKDEIRQRLIAAAFATLRDRGYAETSARAIAEVGGFNQAQIFYYFGSVNGLLVAALECSSLEQLAAYRETVDGHNSISELLAAVRARLEEDLTSGHVKVLTELIAAGTSDPALREMVLELFTPWMEFARETLARVLGPTGLAELVPLDQAAHGVVSLFLGMQQMVTLTGNAGAALEMFASAQKVAALFDQMFSPA